MHVVPMHVPVTMHAARAIRTDLDADLRKLNAGRQSDRLLHRIRHGGGGRRRRNESWSGKHETGGSQDN
jgi:hypothetical protein